MPATEDYTPKNIFLTGGAGTLRNIDETPMIYPIVVVERSKMTVD
jgi:hypothetical protein